jgi:hypothetical protein
MKSVSNSISYIHEFSWIFLNFYLIVLSYFCLVVFLIRKITATGSHLSASLSPHQARPSACPFREAAMCPRLCRTRPHRAIKAPADSASPLSEPRRRLAVGAPPDRACLNAAISTVRARLTAESHPAPPSVRPSRCRFPRVAAPPRLTLKSDAAPHHPLPVCAGARREELPHRQSFGRLHRHDPLHGERSPEHPLPPFSPGIPASELPPHSYPDTRYRRPPEHPPRQRTPPPSGFSTLPVDKKLR